MMRAAEGLAGRDGKLVQDLAFGDVVRRPTGGKSAVVVSSRPLLPFTGMQVFYANGDNEIHSLNRYFPVLGYMPMIPR